MELSKNYEPQQVEDNWYHHWIEKKYFNSTADDSKDAYTIVMPPPNVTGVLHMGHCLNNTIQDILIRRARVQGFNACWVPGTDHASIATEAKVVAMLKEKGIDKAKLTRDEFIEYCWEWKDKYGGIILDQLKKLGCSVDWNRTTFTMDDHYYQAVISVFVDLYKKGLIYRGVRMVNWDAEAKTALSDEEVIRKETPQKLYFITYKVVDTTNDTESTAKQQITIATVRPETIMGDVAIAVNPSDERYTSLIGKYAIVPLIGRHIPIIADDYVETGFGTGALKITPAHDINDYRLGEKHGLPVIDVLNDDGTLNKNAQIYVGEDRFEARKKIVQELEEKGYLQKQENYTSEVGYSERTHTIVEPKLKLQWWLQMKQLAQPALEAVNTNNISFYPARFKNTYNYWMENIRDWNISRQLWWGQRIPAWYDAEGNVVVANTIDEAVQEYTKLYPTKPSATAADLKQDEDCLDTWFSSWIWPEEVFKGISAPENNTDLQYYYPTTTLVTAPEIIFFWVARMIMAGFKYENKKPFNSVYFTGIVRDKQGRKMSKSLGNSPDLLKLIDQYGADAVRFGIMIASPAGNDILFDESSLEQGRNFNNKMWNALKLILKWKNEASQTNESASNTNTASSNFPIQWMEARLKEAYDEMEVLYSQYKLSEVLKLIYSLIWNDFCSWYLEWVKPAQGQTIDNNTLNQTITFYNKLLQFLHPIMPFITEHIYHQLQNTEQDICVLPLSMPYAENKQVLLEGNLLKESITLIRDTKNKMGLKPKDTIDLFIKTDLINEFKTIEQVLAKQVNASSITFTLTDIPDTTAVVLDNTTFYIKSESSTNATSENRDQQKAQINKELSHLQNFLQSIEAKLRNEKFMNNAKPEVIALEQKKQHDTQEKIKTLQTHLQRLG